MFTGMVKLTTSSERETEQLGKLLGKIVGVVVHEIKEKTPVITIKGELGAGKTVLVRGAAEGLGVIVPVRSPSFTLCNVYTGKIPVYHFDFYRLEDEGELHILDLEEYLESGEGVAFIEWAEKFMDVLPPNRLEVSMSRSAHDINSDTREITFTPKGEISQVITERLAENLEFNLGGRLC